MAISFADRIEVNAVDGIFRAVFSLYALKEFLRSPQIHEMMIDIEEMFRVKTIKRQRIRRINRLMYQLNVQLSRSSDARLSY